ncbi:MAG: TonB C-terminal domain-containing protein, partial [Proteobacteria bacterium]|nr:TonB C-terminal domain-containing protein [Pseudomonadota bacterium]
KKLARLKKRARGRTGPRRLSASQKIARLKKRRPQAFGPGAKPGNYGLPGGRTHGGGGTAESYYATLVKSRVVRTLRRYGRWTKRNVQVTILMRVSRTGRLEWARVHKGSGDQTYDHRVLGAVRGIRQFVPFQEAIKKSWLEFTITIYSSAISGRA